MGSSNSCPPIRSGFGGHFFAHALVRYLGRMASYPSPDREGGEAFGVFTALPFVSNRRRGGKRGLIPVSWTIRVGWKPTHANRERNALSRSKRKKHGERPTRDASSGGATVGAPPEPDSNGDSPRRFGLTWFRRKGPVFRFVAVFTILMSAFAAFFFAYFTQTEAFESYLNLNAKLSAWIIRLLGDDAHSSGYAVVSSRASVQIRHGCDAIFPSALFVGAVLASPVRFAAKVPGIFVGTVVLLSINLIRIISLYYTRIYFPKLFHVMHVDVWQPAFIFLALFFWIMWALRATRRPVESTTDA